MNDTKSAAYEQLYHFLVHQHFQNAFSVSKKLERLINFLIWETV